MPPSVQLMLPSPSNWSGWRQSPGSGELHTSSVLWHGFTTKPTCHFLLPVQKLSRNWIFPRPRAVAERGPSQQQPLHNFRPVPSDWQDVHGILHAPMPWYQSCSGTRRARSCCPARRWCDGGPHGWTHHAHEPRSFPCCGERSPTTCDDLEELKAENAAQRGMVTGATHHQPPRQHENASGSWSPWISLKIGYSSGSSGKSVVSAWFQHHSITAHLRIIYNYQTPTASNPCPTVGDTWLQPASLLDE